MLENTKKLFNKFDFSNFIFVIVIFSNLILWDNKNFNSMYLSLLGFFLVYKINFLKFNYYKYFSFYVVLLFIIINSFINTDNYQLTLKSISGLLVLSFLFLFFFEYIQNSLRNAIRLSFIFLFIYLILIFINKHLYFFNNQSSTELINSYLFNIVTQCSGFSINHLDILFTENSHIAMILPSLVIYYFFYNQNVNYFNLFIFLGIIIISLLYTSTTLMVGYLLSCLISIFIFYYYKDKNFIKSIKLFSLVTVIFISLIFLIESCKKKYNDLFLVLMNNHTNSQTSYIMTKKAFDLDAIELNEYKSNLSLKTKIRRKHTNITSTTFVVHLYHAYDMIFIKPFGWGINNYQKSFESNYNKVKDKLRIKKNSIPNSNDGSSVLIKSIVEFGFLNLLFLYEIIKFIFLRSNKDLDLKVFILSLISIQLLRGAGYFNGGFLFFFLFIVFYNLNNKITIHK